MARVFLGWICSMQNPAFGPAHRNCCYPFCLQGGSRRQPGTRSRRAAGLPRCAARAEMVLALTWMLLALAARSGASLAPGAAPPGSELRRGMGSALNDSDGYRTMTGFDAIRCQKSDEHRIRIRIDFDTIRYRLMMDIGQESSSVR